MRQLSPNLKALFGHLKPLIRASRTGLPAARDFLAGLRPVLNALDPFLANLNPVIRYLGFYRTEATGFLAGPPTTVGDTLALQTNKPVCGIHEAPSSHCVPAPIHGFHQNGNYSSNEAFSVYPQRLSTNRGNGYPQPNALTNESAAVHGIFPNFDCKPTGGEVNQEPPDPKNPNCFVAPKFPNEFGGGQAPKLFAEP